MKQYTDALDKMLSQYLVKQAPVLPKNIKDILVKLAPYFAILAVIFGLPAILAVLGLGAILTPMAWVAGTRTGFYWLFWVVGLVQIVIAGMSIKPLFARAGHGWRLSAPLYRHLARELQPRQSRLYRPLPLSAVPGQE